MTDDLDAWVQSIPPAPPLRMGLVVSGEPLSHAPCAVCCHWSLPLALKATDTGRALVALTYEQWLVWHLHAVIHQSVAAPA